MHLVHPGTELFEPHRTVQLLHLMLKLTIARDIRKSSFKKGLKTSFCVNGQKRDIKISFERHSAWSNNDKDHLY